MRPHLVHCSLHKCLTVYYRRVMDGVFNRSLPWRGGYRHYNSDIESFNRTFEEYKVSSINNRFPDLTQLGAFRITRFVRDPRDLVVSGYFYHRRGAEPWCTVQNPTDADWGNATRIPDGLRAAGGSLSDYLQSLDMENGLLAELELREPHFASLAAWPNDHPDIRVFRYEHILGNELATFDAIFEHYGLSPLERRLGRFFARRHALKPSSRRDPHIRNPSSGQWREHFTPRVRAAFDAQWGGLLEKLGYEP